MAINNIDIYMKNLWDFDFLKGCFGNTKGRPSDIDAIVEWHGQFLVIEMKSRGARIPQGQAIMFQSMADMENFTVLILWGKPSEAVAMRVWGEDKKDADNKDVRKFVSEWFKAASEKKRVNRKQTIEI